MEHGLNAAPISYGNILLLGIAAGLAVLVLFCCASLLTMSIGAGVVIAISFQKVNAAPHAEAGAQGNHQGLKSRNCGLKKCHIGFCRNRMIPSPKSGGGFRSGNSFSRIAPRSLGSVSGVKVSVVVGVYQKKCSHGTVAALDDSI